jgi:hypothetical protein
MKFYITNKSTVISDVEYSNILQSLKIYLSSLCKDWDFAPIYVLNSIQPLEKNLPNTVIIFDAIDDEVFNTYNYEQDPNSVARIFAKTVIESGGVVLYQDESTMTVAQILCNEILGLISNLNMNKWYMDSNTSLWWGDICAPVYGNILNIDLPSGVKVGLSDYVLPCYFGPNGVQGPFNKNNTLMGPFGIDEYGYSIKFENGNFNGVFGPNCQQEKIDQISDYIEEFKSRFNKSI